MKRIALFAICTAVGLNTGCSRADNAQPLVARGPSRASGAPAAALFANGGFESGDLTGWTRTSYLNAAGLTCADAGDCAGFPPATEAELHLADGGTITTSALEGIGGDAGSADLTIFDGGSDLRYPLFGSWAALVNDQSSTSARWPSPHGQNINVLSQQFETTPADIDPADGLIHVRFVIAPVLENGEHTPDTQPYYFVQISNVTQGTILRTQYAFANQPGYPWKKESGGNSLTGSEVDYTDWLLFDVAPGSAALGVGDAVKVEIVAAGCQPGGHAGMVLVDGFGSFIPGLAVAATAPAQVNANTPFSYTYTVRNGGAEVATNVVVTQPVLPGTSFSSYSVPAGASCTAPLPEATSGNIVCNLGALNPSATTHFSIALVATAITSDLPNGLYSIDADGVPSLYGNKVDTAVAASGTYADLYLTVSDSVAAVAWGSSTTYAVVVGNNGPAGSPSAAIDLPIPVGVSSGTWSCGGAVGGATVTGAPGGSGALATTFNLPAGSSATCSYVAQVGAGAGTSAVTFSGSIADPNVIDPQPANNAAADQDQVGTLITISVESDFEGTGVGTILSAPAAIACGQGCSAQFVAGLPITLTSIAASSSQFVAWGGAFCNQSTAAQCTFTPTSDAQLAARFDILAFAISTSVTGLGTLSCPATAQVGTSPLCAATPAAGYVLSTLVDNGSAAIGRVADGTYTIVDIQGPHALGATFVKLDGQACAGNADCGSGFCVDGLCCNSACAGQCQACDGAAAPGICSTVTAGAPHGNRAACIGDGSACNGLCDGQSATACDYPGAATQCRAATCADGVGTAPASCNESGSCPAMTTLSCGRYGCGALGCNTSCSSDQACASGNFCASGQCAAQIAPGGACAAADQCASGECVDGICCASACGNYACSSSGGACQTSCGNDRACGSAAWCNPGGQCVPKSAQASACTADDQCASAACVDGYCCNRGCHGQCEACDVAGSTGTCVELSQGQPHGTRELCASDGSACAGSCDGNSSTACDYPGLQSQCRAASCANGVFVSPASCAGSGSCPVLVSTSCGQFACNPAGSACNTACSVDRDCVSGSYCSAGTCELQGKSGSAVSCTADDQCADHHCVDGLCCNTACDGECEACDVANDLGTCSPAHAGDAPHGARVACKSDGAGCGGRCDGTRRLTCGYPGASTSCRAGACAAGVATLAAGCNGAGACAPEQAQSCSPFLCGAGSCAGNCIADSDCPGGDFCSAGVCTAMLPAGSVCAGTDQCATGFCTDGVCCNTSCDGQCAACDLPGLAGTCSPVTGAPVGPRDACSTDGSSCGGSCDGTSTSLCSYPGVGTTCRAGSCSGGVAVMAGVCNAAGACPPEEDVSCGASGCASTTCAGGCAVDTDCGRGTFCAAGVCSAQKSAGSSCGATDQCASGNCVDGLCCDTACTGPCEACDVPGRAGSCSPVPPGGEPHGARQTCINDGSGCGGACDGVDTGLCAYPSAETACRAPSCTGDVAILGASCNGDGQCPSVQTQGCGSFACGDTSCNGDCVTDSDCAGQSFCSGGICAPRIKLGEACSTSDQCQSGACVDGLCCNRACDGQCEACDVPGHLGTCGPASGAPHGARAACASDGSACGGSCDGVESTSCAYPAATVKCGSASCAAGVASAASFCSGAGACAASIQSSCGPFACAQASCGSSCTGDAECASGSSCVASACVVNGTPGTFKLAGSGGCASGGADSLFPLSMLALFAAFQLARRRARSAAVQLARRRMRFAAGALLLALAIPAAARAQAMATDAQLVVDRFLPGPGAADILQVGAAQTPGDFQLHLSAFADYANQPLRLISSGDASQSLILLRYQSMAYVGASIGLFDRFELGLTIPMLIAQGASTTQELGPSLAPAGSGIGDLRVVPKAKLWEDGALVLAAALPFTLPTGAGHAYLSSGSATFSPELRLETQREWLPVRLILNAGVALRESRALVDLNLGDAFTWGAAGEVPFHLAGEKLAAIATISGEIGLNAGHELERPTELDLALRWLLPAGVNLLAGGGPGISNGYGTPRFRLFVGVGFSPGSAPAPACAPCSCLKAEDASVRTEAGEPVEIPVRGSNESGAAIRVVRVEPPKHGAVEHGASSVFHYQPAPGYSGEDELTLVLTDGARTAREHVLIEVSARPQPSAPPPPPDAIVEAPPAAPQLERVVRSGHIALLARVLFASDKAEIIESSLGILDGVAKVLRENPDFRQVRIDGHTDNRGDAAHNRDLSLRRAEAVRDYLEKIGVEAFRLEVNGFGPDQPLASNQTADGQAHNRRVEFVVIDGPKPEPDVGAPTSSLPPSAPDAPMPVGVSSAKVVEVALPEIPPALPQ